MPLFKILIQLFIPVFAIYSCNPCKNVDPPSPNYGAFRIVGKIDGKDLVFGSNKVYNKNLIRFYSLQGQDTTFLNYHPIKSLGIGYDSILMVEFSWNPETAYMRLSDGDIDTFNVTYQSRPHKCYPTLTEITSFRYNNLIVIPPSDGVYELKK